MSNEINTKVESVRRFFKENKAANHPITEHPVSKQEEYVRDLYLDMLCVFAQYESVDTENAFTFIKRIMAACKDIQPFDEYIRRSMELTTEKTTEFIMQCKENNLCEIFFVDSLIIACANGTPNSKQIVFMAQFGDMLEFDKDKMTEMSEFVLAILEQDSDNYQQLLNESNADVQLNLLCYAKKFVTGLIICTSTKRHYYAPELVDIPFNKKIKLSNIDEVIIENLAFVNNTIFVEHTKKLKITNCLFHDYEYKYNNEYRSINTICVKNTDDVIIKECNFKNCICKGGNDAIIRNCSVQYLDLSYCRFDNIKNPTTYYDSDAGAVIYFSGDTNVFAFDRKRENIYISNCEFNNCQVNGRDSGVIIYKKGYPEVHISNSRFSDCRGNYMFADCSFNLATDINNQYINCCTKKRG